MMGEEAGWYRDPAPPNPSAPTTLRYWDGKNWTTQVKQAGKRERQLWAAEAAAQQREWAAQQLQAQMQAQMQAQAGTQAQAGMPTTGYGGQPGVLVMETSRDLTPDGARLAGWWQRVGASVIDGLITGAIGLVAGWRFIQQVSEVFSRAMPDAVQAGQTGGVAQTDAIAQQMMGPLFALVAVMWGVRFVYHVGFLKAFGATPGKMALGLEVRLRERPGPLSWGTVLIRWFTQNLGGLLSFVPIVALFAWVYPLLDVLWPLWDGHRQALHDKAARTNVVRTR